MKKLQIIISTLVLAGAISAGSFVYANRETEQPKEEVKVEQVAAPVVEQPVEQTVPVVEEKVVTPVKTAEPIKETPKVESAPVQEIEEPAISSCNENKKRLLVTDRMANLSYSERSKNTQLSKATTEEERQTILDSYNQKISIIEDLYQKELAKIECNE